MRRQFTPEQKAAVAMAALRGDKTINQIASEYEVNPTQVKLWRDAVKANMIDTFADKRTKAVRAKDTERQIDELHRVIGVRDAELEWLKKRFMGWDSRFRPADLTPLIEPNHPELTIARQADLLGLDRQAYYYEPAANVAAEQLLKRDMDAIDAVYTDYPFYGSRRMQDELRDRYEIDLGRARIRTVMQLLGLEAVYPKPNTSKPGVGSGHTVYPYLLRSITAHYPNHIWGTDITYIRTRDGFVYLVAFMDWYSRYVVSWQLSDTLHNGFVIQALKDALCFVADCGLPLPDICNSDQGSHFTSQAYTELLEQAGVQISMDGRGRCLDNIFTERLWRTVKYENVFLNSYQNLENAALGLEQYFWFYNTKRRHQGIDCHTPAQLYFDTRIDPTK